VKFPQNYLVIHCTTPFYSALNTPTHNHFILRFSTLTPAIVVAAHKLGRRKIGTDQICIVIMMMMMIFTNVVAL